MRQMIKIVTLDGAWAFIHADTIESILPMNVGDSRILTVFSTFEGRPTNIEVNKAEAERIMAKVNGTYEPPPKRQPRAAPALRMRQGLQRGDNVQPNTWPSGTLGWPGADTTESS